MISVTVSLPPSTEELSKSYAALGSVKKVGAAFGISAQTVHRRLKAAGLDMSRRVSAQDKEAVRVYYTTTPHTDFDLKAFAASLGRHPSTVSELARHMGLSQAQRLKSDAAKVRMRQPKWQDKPHPKGFAGVTHSEAARAQMGAASKKMWATAKAFGTGICSEENKQRKSDLATKRTDLRSRNPYSRCAAGVRPDIGPMYFRSRWEANYARYLKLLKRMNAIEDWDYEQETFWFEKIKRGVRSYKPDFRVWYKGDGEPTCIEIKGWVQPKDRTKWDRMRRYYPGVRLEIVGAKEYRALASKWAASIPFWESETRGRDVPLSLHLPTQQAAE